jgi:hypothetical protein
MSGRRLLAVSVLFFVLGVLNDAPWRRYSSSQELIMQSEALKVAQSLATTGSFSNPFVSLDTGPTAHVAPAFPLVVSLLMRSFGFGPHGWLALRVLAMSLIGLLLALLPYAARTFGFSAWVGIGASVLGLIAKPGMEERWEANLAAVASLLMAMACLRWSNARSTSRAIVAGGAAAAAMYVQPIFVIPFVLWVVLQARAAWLPITATAALLIAPWIIRNQIMLGGPAFIRDNLGIEVNVGFNDCVPYGFQENLATSCLLQRHPHNNPVEAAEVRDMGEYFYNKDRLQRGLAYIRSHPQRSATLIAQRIFYFWFPSDHGWDGYLEQRYRTRVIHLLTPLSFAGLWLAFRRRIPAAPLLAIILATYPLIYYITQFAARYRQPILWVTWMLASYCVAELFRRRTHDRVPVSSGQRDHAGNVSFN